MTAPIKTWLQLAQEAYRVQDACNLMGVAHSFARVVLDVRDRLEADGLPADTTSIATHHVSVLWADKIAHLTATQSLSDTSGRVTAAYAWVRSVGGAE